MNVVRQYEYEYVTDRSRFSHDTKTVENIIFQKKYVRFLSVGLKTTL